jgi:predicted CoA-binding protein
LFSIPEPVEMVDVFRQPEHLPAIVAQAVCKQGVRVLWCQLGVINLEAARTAQAAGITVVMDRCPAIEYRRLLR